MLQQAGCAAQCANRQCCHLQKDGIITVSKTEDTRMGMAQHGLSRWVGLEYTRVAETTMIHRHAPISAWPLRLGCIWSHADGRGIRIAYTASPHCCRSLTSNMVVGVSSGFKKVMELVGTGYRAAVAGQELTLNVGYSKPRVLAIPEGLKVTVSTLT